jgi:hypothetical protein
VSQPQNEAAQAARGLTDSLKGMTRELARLNKYGKTNRHLIVVTFASIALDLILTFFLVFTYSTAHDAGQVASAEHSSLIASCVAGNQTRAEQVTLWSHLAAVSTPPRDATKAQRAKDEQQIGMLLRYIRHVFAARPCAQVYATSRPAG